MKKNEIPRKPRAIRMTDEEHKLFLEYGYGNLSSAFARVIEEIKKNKESKK